MNKEQWINEVFNSTTGMKRAVPDNNLYENVINQINIRQGVVSISFIRFAAIAMILLILLNAGTLFFVAKKQRYNSEIQQNNNQQVIELQNETSYTY